MANLDSQRLLQKFQRQLPDLSPSDARTINAILNRAKRKPAHADKFLNGYTLWYRELSASEATTPDITKRAKVLGKRWKQLPPAERLRYQRDAANLRETAQSQSE
jgi:hypothetical protein